MQGVGQIWGGNHKIIGIKRAAVKKLPKGGLSILFTKSSITANKYETHGGLIREKLQDPWPFIGEDVLTTDFVSLL